MINKKIIDNCPTLDSFIDMMSSDQEGKRISFPGIGTNEEFKNRFKMFKEVLVRDVPNFSSEEIIKIHNHYNEVKEIYSWYGFDFLLKALEFETLKNK